MTIDVNDINAAYFEYRKLTNSPANINTVRRFWKFIGYEGNLNGSLAHVWYLMKNTETGKRRVEMLLSPNAKALYKIWKIQNDDK